MKKRLALLLAGAMILGMLTGCGGGAEEKKEEPVATEEAAEEVVEETVEEAPVEEESYEAQTFNFEDWEVTITKDELLYDNYYERDALVLYITAVNNGEAGRFSDLANFIGFQHDENLDWAQVQDANGEYIANTAAGKEETPTGGSVDLVYAWTLDDDSTVTVSFHGFTVDVEGTEIEFEVADRITDEWKKTIEEDKKALEEKQSATGLDMKGISGELVDGWYVDYAEEKSAKLAREGEDATISITVSTTDATAQERAEKQLENYQEEKQVTTETIGDATYVCVTINPDQVILFADSSEGAIKIQTMFCALDAAKAQLEAFTIK